jgi:hypothetical protein
LENQDGHSDGRVGVKMKMEKYLLLALALALVLILGKFLHDHTELLKVFLPR